MRNYKELGAFLVLHLTVSLGVLGIHDVQALSSPIFQGKSEKKDGAGKENSEATEKLKTQTSDLKDAPSQTEKLTPKTDESAEKTGKDNKDTVSSDAATPAAQMPELPKADTDKKETVVSQPKFDLSQGFSSIAEKVIPGVVNVSTTQVIEGRDRGNLPQFAPGSPLEEFFKDFFEQMDKPRRVQSLGSGFVTKLTTKDGSNLAYVVTNYHVIADAKKITVIFHDNSEVEATLQGVDDRTDLAVLKVNLDSLSEEKRKNLVALDWADSHKSKVGDWVLAVGNPFGLGGTVTAGILSNISRNINLKPNPRSRVSEYVDDFMQHDAPINMGNSGGPLVNLEGKVVGINTAIFSPSGGNVGIGFAIPAALASETVQQLMEFGRTKRGWLGVRIQNVSDDMAESYGLPKARGAIVASLTPKGPAANAGIEPGDIILEFDGKEVNEKNRLSRIVGETEVGKDVQVKLWRKGKEVQVTARLGEFETSSDSSQSESTKGMKSSPTEIVEVLGLKISKLNATLSKQYQVPENIEGVVVVDIASDSAAATSGVQPGDVIVEANQVQILEPEQFIKQVNEVKKDRKNITLLINRRGDMRFYTVKLEDELKERSAAQGG